MQVVKRNGQREEVSFDKILHRVKNRSSGLSVDPVVIAQKVVAGLCDGITTRELDRLLIETAAVLAPEHPDYDKLAAAIAASALHKETPEDFWEAWLALHKAGVLADTFMYDAQALKPQGLDSLIDYSRDFNFSYFGFKTLESKYLLGLVDTSSRKRVADGSWACERKIVERPQSLFLRVAVGICGPNIEKVKKLYDYLSLGYYTHATPTLFNAGTSRAQMSSCFVEGTEILTVNDGVKPIQTVQIGDSVVTHKGTVEKVVQLHKNKLNDRQLYDVKVFKTPSFTVTGNHRFFSITKEQLKWGEKPQMNSIEHLRAGDYIAIPNMISGQKDYDLDLADFLHHLPKSDNGNIHFSFDVTDDQINILRAWQRPHRLNDTDSEVYLCKKNSSIKRFVRIDKDFAKFLGIWYGDGSIASGKNSSGNRYLKNINVAIHHENRSVIDFCRDYISRTFGLNVKVSHFPHSKNPNVVSVTAHSGVLANLFNYFFGKGFDGKRLFKDIFYWDKELVIAFLDGLVSSDGHVYQNGMGYGLTMSNKRLVKEIYMVARQVGFDVSYQDKGSRTAYIFIPHSIGIKPLKIYKDDRIEKAFCKNTWSSQVVEIDGTKFLRITNKVKNSSKPEYVYTFGVEKTHSYSVLGLLAENCFLIATKNDSLEGIYDTDKECALISKNSGGVGLWVHNVRADGAVIKSSQRFSDGIIPMLRHLNATFRYVNQGGKRRGSAAIYLEPWHADVEDFLDLRKNTGDDERRCHDLFTALWIPDLFMKRLQEGGNWTLFSPDEAPGLFDCWGEDFERLYEQYEKEGLGRKVVKASDLMKRICASQKETGTPYMLYKDAANRKSNQQNLGTIKSSNLCFTGDTLVAVADGRNPVSIEKLASEGGKFLVYSAKERKQRKLGLKDGKVQHRSAWQTEIKQAVAFKTGTKKVISVNLSNGDSFRCTPDHQIALFDGGYVEASKSLHAQLAPFYTFHCYENFFNKDENGNIHEKGLIVTGICDLAEEEVYDLTVEDNHNFYIITSTEDADYLNCQGVLVHNCTEIIEYSDAEQTAVCNLASICLPKFVKEDRTYDFESLKQVAYDATINLNYVIDKNFYPTPATKNSNLKHRPIGIGVQGLADTFMMLRLPYDSPEARKLNHEIFETIYLGAMQASVELAERDGPYESFAGSPLSKGIFQFDLWKGEHEVPLRYKEEWELQRQCVKKYGARNSLLLAPMPTASTSQIFDNFEAFEIHTSNLYKRETLAGEFVVINKHLVKHLQELGLWDKKMMDQIISNNGSVQQILRIPEDVRKIYRTVWEISQKVVIDMAVDRGVFVCQSQSMNIHMANPTLDQIASLHLYAWKRGLKTGMYYLRTKAAKDSVKVTVQEQLANDVAACSIDNPEACDVCSS